MECTIAIELDDTIGRISPGLHGHFLEHLGTATYGGLWVGRDSRIPHIDGLRRDAVEYLRDLAVPVLRWPGGCFADTYHWRNGIGLPSSRPVTVNHPWGGTTEDNGFGTHEFMQLCTLIGAQPYLAGNLGAGSPAELRDWVEYCNYPSRSSLAELRAANGHKEPFGVRYWGIGNESWACGGHLTPEEYCGLYARFATFVPTCGGTAPYLIAVGPNNNDTAWTERFFQAFRNGRSYHPPLNAFAMHYYSWGTRKATGYDASAVRKQFASFDDMERAITVQRAFLDRHERLLGCAHIDLIVDEWGTWDLSDVHEEELRGRLWQQNTIKDGVAAALGLNVFHRNADKLAMCNLAQIINVLQAPLLTFNDVCVRTPTYYAMHMMRAHRGGTSVRASSPYVPSQDLSVSASVKDNTLAVTLVNPDPENTKDVTCRVHGRTPLQAHAVLLTHRDPNACNSPEHPACTIPLRHPVSLEEHALNVTLPPNAVLHASITLPRSAQHDVPCEGQQ
jgi:alpha-L-arabinofuranosidase